jgi:ElaB/YqjD/DUF883 family membrane-anchored ribosome-binding protein
MMRAEDRIIEDIMKIKNALAPENVANQLVARVGEKLSRKIETMDTQGIKKASIEKITGAMEAVKSHAGAAALLGFGANWLMADRMFKRQKTSEGKMIEQLQEETGQSPEKMQRYAQETGEVIAGKSQSVLEGVSGYVDENPLTAGFIGLSAGLILGILTSGVLRKKGLLEETGLAVQEKTRQILHETKKKAGHAVDAAGSAAGEEAERQHVIPH